MRTMCRIIYQHEYSPPSFIFLHCSVFIVKFCFLYFLFKRILKLKKNCTKFRDKLTSALTVVEMYDGSTKTIYYPEYVEKNNRAK